jgi:(2R)-3-sulfolactate dehydrogenase (NADP+)
VISLAELESLAESALRAAGANPHQARSTARALVAADAQGLATHGVSRIPFYASHLRSGRVDGQALPRVLASKPATVLVDAADGLSFPACELAVQQAMDRARSQGLALAGICNSYHFGAAAWHLEPVARAGLIGIAMSNSPAAMPVVGGKRPLMGTNPLAAVFPRPDRDGHPQPPLVLDFAMSEVARGKLMVAAQKGESIPLGWALDEHGQPTTDAQAGLRGSMLPFGSANGGIKGALIALMIELLVVTLTGSRFGAEMDTFFEAQGNRLRMGQLFLVFDPGGMAGTAAYAERIEAIVAAMYAEAGVRVPGDQRERKAERAREEGVSIPQALLEQLRQLAQAA